jgi:hypothetical protein
MGDNVMIYVDDIQHCNPEFLQKFISLCDAQRKIEGVYKGRSRTYDLRGRKVCIVMAGNPYTESGEKFQIPDMLSNRADIYNLGEIIGESGDVFEMSYLENALTSNPVLNKLASRSQKDVYSIIHMAQHDQQGVELEGNYSLEEINELVATMQKLIRVRDVILTVNREYIRSAAQSDDYRTEPPFKLQGSYRNMNRIAEKVVPIMNDEELESLILSNYENDAQTLTSDTEANLLKFRELAGTISEEQAKRWADIKKTFQLNVKLRGVGGDDKFGQVIVQMGAFSDGLDSIRDTMSEGIGQLAKQNGETSEAEALAGQLIEGVRGLKKGLEAIGHGLSGGVTQIAELAQAASARSPAVAESTPASAALTTDVLKQLAAELRAIPAQAASLPAGPPSAQSAGGSQTITVVNKIPPTLLNVLRHQFKLMQGWMVPLLKASNSQTAEIQELKQLLDECLNDYAKLLKQVKAARNRSQADD